MLLIDGLKGKLAPVGMSRMNFINPAYTQMITKKVSFDSYVKEQMKDTDKTFTLLQIKLEYQFYLRDMPINRNLIEQVAFTVDSVLNLFLKQIDILGYNPRVQDTLSIEYPYHDDKDSLITTYYDMVVFILSFGPHEEPFKDFMNKVIANWSAPTELLHLTRSRIIEFSYLYKMEDFSGTDLTYYMNKALVDAVTDFTLYNKPFAKAYLPIFNVFNKILSES